MCVHLQTIWVLKFQPFTPVFTCHWCILTEQCKWLYEYVCICMCVCVCACTHLHSKCSFLFVFVWVCILCVIMMSWIIFYIEDVLLCLLLPNKSPHRDNKAVFYGVHTLPDRTAWGWACWSPASAASFSYIPERRATQSESSFWVTTNQKLELHNNQSKPGTA